LLAVFSMTYINPKTNERSGSTTWTPKPDRLSIAARRASKTAGRSPSFRGLKRRDPREPLTIKVRYRGGSEAWVLVEARGVVQAYPGHLSAYDLLMAINSRSSHRPS
jgi:hypothetical protein